MKFFEEKQPWGYTLYDIEEGTLECFKTSRAQVDLITNPHFGRMLFLDGVLQSSEFDEKIYHEALVDFAEPRGRVLIAGGAEGARAREVFARGVESVVMVDWDKELVERMRSEPWSKGALDDPRLKIEYTDIMDFISSSAEKYDTIILDLLDPETPSEIEWLVKVCNKSAKLLLPGGRVVLNAGRRESLPISNSETRSIFVPSFQETWHLIRFGV